MVFAACILMSFLLEGAEAASHADHVCDGDSCPVCLVDQHIKNFSRQLKYLCARFVFSLGVFLLSPFIFKQIFCYMPISSVKLKIKMNT
jgi:hypothetical protein